VTGSHLHWELRVGGIAVDPRQWLTRAFPDQAE
jgi:murein DD-endopeptidase MepM/ murein hydrolase activator NlpD